MSSVRGMVGGHRNVTRPEVEDVTTPSPSRETDRRSQRERLRHRLGGRPSKHWMSTGLCWILAVLWILPYVWMVILSLKPNSLQFATAGRVLTGPYTLRNFGAAWSYAPFGRFLVNSVAVAATGSFLTICFSLLAGYGFARLPSRFLNRAFRVLVATLFIPPIVFVIPLYVEMRVLGWIDTYQSLIIPFAFGALGVFLMRQGFASIPRELEEAASIDGASRWGMFWRIMVPQVRSFTAVLFIFSFLVYWNNFLWPLVVINGSSHSTVPLGLELFLGEHGGQWNLLMAATMFTILPALLIVVVFQRSIVRGLGTAGLGGR